MASVIWSALVGELQDELAELDRRIGAASIVGVIRLTANQRICSGALSLAGQQRRCISATTPGRPNAL